MRIYKLSILITLAISIAGINSSKAYAGSWNGWVYQNPYPTKNSILATKFVTPKKGWVAGEHGIILYTEDGGDTWNAQKSGTDEDIRSLSFTNEKHGWAVGKNGLILHTRDNGKKWISQGNSTSTLNCVFSISDKEAWAVGNEGIVLHTMDSGEKWNRLALGIPRAVASIYFRNHQTGWMIAGDTIYRTTDSGKTWEKSLLEVELPTPGAFGSKSGIINPRVNNLPYDWWEGDVFFSDDKNGWAVAGTWQIFHTTDGGKRWDVADIGYMSYGLSRIAFGDGKKGCVAGTSILCTENGGETWQEQLGIKAGERGAKDGFTISLWGLSFTTPTMGWAVGIEGEILKTTDGGKTWDVQSRGRVIPDYFFDSRLGWSRNYKLSKKKASMVKTDDGGMTWTVQKTFDAAMDANYFFINPTTGWSAGEEWEQTTTYGPIIHYSFILKTEDGGKTWVSQYHVPGGERGVTNELRDICFISSSEGWVVGAKGLILHTADGGKNWDAQHSGTNFMLAKVQFVNDKIGWALGNEMKDGTTSIILNTNDGGKYWKIQWKKEDEWMWVDDLFFINEKVGWIIGAVNEYSGDAIFLRTVDGGKTWSEKLLSKIFFTKMAFFDSNHGVILTEKGTLLITSDGGKTWRKEQQPIRKLPWHISEVVGK